MKYNLDPNYHPVMDVFFDEYPLPMRAMIDTGARDNFIFIGSKNPDLECRLKKTGKRLGATAAGGHSIDCPEAEATIWIGKDKFDLTFGVTSGTFYNVNMILGTKFLHDHGLSLHVCQGNFLLQRVTNLDRLYFWCNKSH